MPRTPYPDDNPYPRLRELLAPEYAELPTEELEALLEGVSAEDLESFLSDVGRVFRKALPVVGTVAGTALGGPVGAALGGLAGQAASGAIGAASGAGRRRPPRRGRRPPTASPSLPAGGSPAAAQLLQLLARPQTLQALASMALGGAGRRQVRVGQTPVPLGAITNLLGVLANQAAAEHHAATAGEASGTPLYLLDDAGEFLVDPADPAERAAALLQRFGEQDEADGMVEYGNDDEMAEDDEMAALDAFYDELEWLELDDDAYEPDGAGAWL